MGTELSIMPTDMEAWIILFTVLSFAICSASILASFAVFILISLSKSIFCFSPSISFSLWAVLIYTSLLNTSSSSLLLASSACTFSSIFFSIILLKASCIALPVDLKALRPATDLAYSSSNYRLIYESNKI